MIAKYAIAGSMIAGRIGIAVNVDAFATPIEWLFMLYYQSITLKRVLRIPQKAFARYPVAPDAQVS